MEIAAMASPNLKGRESAFSAFLLSQTAQHINIKTVVITVSIPKPYN
jgi:hypothetical protein